MSHEYDSHIEDTRLAWIRRDTPDGVVPGCEQVVAYAGFEAEDDTVKRPGLASADIYVCARWVRRWRACLKRHQYRHSAERSSYEPERGRSGCKGLLPQGQEEHGDGEARASFVAKLAKRESSCNDEDKT